MAEHTLSLPQGDLWTREFPAASRPPCISPWFMVSSPSSFGAGGWQSHPIPGFHAVHSPASTGCHLSDGHLGQRCCVRTCISLPLGSSDCSRACLAALTAQPGVPACRGGGTINKTPAPGTGPREWLVVSVVHPQLPDMAADSLAAPVSRVNSQPCVNATPLATALSVE